MMVISALFTSEAPFFPLTTWTETLGASLLKAASQLPKDEDHTVCYYPLLNPEE